MNKKADFDVNFYDEKTRQTSAEQTIEKKDTTLTPLLKRKDRRINWVYKESGLTFGATASL